MVQKRSVYTASGTRIAKIERLFSISCQPRSSPRVICHPSKIVLKDPFS